MEVQRTPVASASQLTHELRAYNSFYHWVRRWVMSDRNWDMPSDIGWQVRRRWIGWRTGRDEHFWSMERESRTRSGKDMEDDESTCISSVTLQSCRNWVGNNHCKYSTSSTPWQSVGGGGELGGGEDHSASLAIKKKRYSEIKSIDSTLPHKQ